MRDRVVLDGISSRAWECPGDRGALAALRRLEGYDALHQAVLRAGDDAALRRDHQDSAVRVDARQLPRLHALFAEGAEALDVGGLPELYLATDPVPRARTSGVSTPIVLVTSGLVELLDDEELRFVLAGQLGHAVSGHASYATLLRRLAGLTALAGAGARTIEAALAEWSGQAEVSADRAGLLATQDPTVAVSALMRLASGGRLSELDAAEFHEQGEPSGPTASPQPLAGLLLDGEPTRDRPVARAGALRRWIDEGAYARVLAGDYPRRDDDADLPLSEAARAAATAYAVRFLRTRAVFDDLVDAVGAGGPGTGLRRRLDDAFRRS